MQQKSWYACTLRGRVDISDKKKHRPKQVETFKYPGSMITAAKKKWELDGESGEKCQD